jgi:hypothetical protein
MDDSASETEKFGMSTLVVQVMKILMAKRWDGSKLMPPQVDSVRACPLAG